MIAPHLFLFFLAAMCCLGCSLKGLRELTSDVTTQQPTQKVQPPKLIAKPYVKREE